MTMVIGLHGAKGSGKDQFFKAVEEAFPHLDVRKIAYADPIKAAVQRIMTLDSEKDYDNFKRFKLTYSLSTAPDHIGRIDGRHVVREIGMLMRSYDENQFVRYVEIEISKAPQAVWFITDLRFDNELQAIRRNPNGIVIKIKRGGVDYDGHVTETEFPDLACDSIIRNVDLTLKQYNQLVVDEMNCILQTFSIIKD